MTPAAREFQLALIRLLKGSLTAWEKWLQAEYLAGLPEGTPEDVMDILSKSKIANAGERRKEMHRPRD